MPQCVAELNRLLESDQDLPADIWERWLWHTNPAEPATVECLLNEMHLLGLIIARYRALREPGLADHVLSIPNISHLRSRVALLTPRQLRDVVEDVQMHWERYLCETSDELVDVVDACMVRFGEINLHGCKCDDVSMADTNNTNRLSHASIRRFVSIFFVMYWNCYISFNRNLPIRTNFRSYCIQTNFGISTPL
jgi:hypothetical protein